MAKRVRNGCCNLLHLHEENSRFLLLALVLLLYMVFGAIVFHLLESDAELNSRQKYRHVIDKFQLKYRHLINESDLIELLDAFDAFYNGSAYGVTDTSDATDRWSLSGSFYFVATVVSTIGKHSTLVALIVKQTIYISI